MPIDQESNCLHIDVPNPFVNERTRQSRRDQCLRNPNKSFSIFLKNESHSFLHWYRTYIHELCLKMRRAPYSVGVSLSFIQWIVIIWSRPSQISISFFTLRALSDSFVFLFSTFFFFFLKGNT